MQIYKSRFTPNVTGDEISLEIGEIVKYQLKDKIIDIKINSERMCHDKCKNLGYEAIFLDDNQRYFADGKRIIWWKGKTNSIEELNAL